MKDNCLFCNIANKIEEGKIIYEDDLVVAVLDAFPHVSGHTLIIPKNHYEDFTEIPNDLIIRMNEVAKKLTPTLMKKFKRDSLTLCVNYGSSQAIKHYHLHLLPGYGAKYRNERIMSRDEAFEEFNR